MTAELYILDTRIDLFKDENIDVISSVIDIADLSKNTNSFTKGFTIPASKNNNIFFKQWFNANIDNSFDARIKHDAFINLDGQHFRFGFVKLIKVIVKSGRASSYSITFSGNLKGISKLVGSDKLASLDLSTYDHLYDSDTVREGLTDSVQLNLDGADISGNVVYTPMAKKQYFIREGGDNTSTDTLQNIAYFGGNDAGIIWNDLKPSIKLTPIIEAIEAKYNLVFSRHFFATDEFTGLSLWLNPTKEKEIQGTESIIDFTVNGTGSLGTSNTFFNLLTDIGTYPVNGALNEGWRIFLSIIPQTGYTTVPFTVKIWVDGEVFSEVDVPDGGNWSNSLDPLILIDATDTTFQVYYEVVTVQEFEYRSSIVQEWYENPATGFHVETFITETGVSVTIPSEFKVTNNIPDIKIIDFLKGLFSMYKIIIIPQDDGSYYVNEINSYFAEGGVYDVSRYVDYDTWDVKAGILYNEIKFNFEEPTTILGLKYKENNNRAFGDEELIVREDPSDSTSPQIDGKTFELKVPFEQLVFERLQNNTNLSLSSVIHATVTDESLEPVNPKPVIHYTVNTFNTATSVIGFQNDLGLKDTNWLTTINNPLHGNTLINTEYSTTFSKDLNVWNNNALSNNLYTNHYKNYIEDTFNVKKREYVFNCEKLPSDIVNNLKLNDLLLVKNNYYRINKFKTNITTGKVSFEVVNYFGTLNIGQPKSSTPNIYTDFNAKTIKTYVANLNVSTVTKVDIAGQGTSWVTVVASVIVDTDQNILELDIETNPLTTWRTMFIDVEYNGYTDRIYVYQSKGVNSLRFNDAGNSFNIATLIGRN